MLTPVEYGTNQRRTGIPVSIRCPARAATATCALNVGEWFRLFLLAMLLLHVRAVWPLLGQGYHSSRCPILRGRLSPAHIRADLDIGYRISGQSVEILEIRPQWNDRSIIHQHPIAKATYVRTMNHSRSSMPTDSPRPGIK